MEELAGLVLLSERQRQTRAAERERQTRKEKNIVVQNEKQERDALSAAQGLVC